jgi:hypothetical protein
MLSEVMTIIIHFHQSNHKDFKNYYSEYVNYSFENSLFAKPENRVFNFRIFST